MSTANTKNGGREGSVGQSFESGIGASYQVLDVILVNSDYLRVRLGLRFATTSFSESWFETRVAHTLFDSSGATGIKKGQPQCPLVRRLRVGLAAVRI
jgi:hypothetical protein